MSARMAAAMFASVICFSLMLPRCPAGFAGSWWRAGVSRTRTGESLFLGRYRMVFVNDDPFAADLSKPTGQTKVDRACRSAFGIEHARRERDIVAGAYRDLTRYEADRSTWIGEEEVPGCVICGQALDGCRKVEHQEIIGVMRKDRRAICRAHSAPTFP